MLPGKLKGFHILGILAIHWIGGLAIAFGFGLQHAFWVGTMIGMVVNLTITVMMLILMALGSPTMWGADYKQPMLRTSGYKRDNSKIAPAILMAIIVVIVNLIVWTIFYTDFFLKYKQGPYELALLIPFSGLTIVLCFSYSMWFLQKLRAYLFST